MPASWADRGESHGSSGHRGPGSDLLGFAGKGKNQVPDEQVADEGGLIVEAINRVISGDTLRGIANGWNRRGFRTTNDGLWTNAKLRQVLTNPRYAGYRRHLGKLYPAKWNPVVEPKLWESARAILEDPSRNTNLRGRAPAYLLTGKVFCGVCGGRMRGRKESRDKQHRKAAYVCDGKNKDGKHCTSRLLEAVDQEVTARFLYASFIGWSRSSSMR
jgi:site-specific DNA recombinase